jgi:hypothetical protein
MKEFVRRTRAGPRRTPSRSRTYFWPRCSTQASGSCCSSPADWSISRQRDPLADRQCDRRRSARGRLLSGTPDARSRSRGPAADRGEPPALVVAAGRPHRGQSQPVPPDGDIGDRMAAARARPARRSASATRCHRRTSTILAAPARPRQPAYGAVDTPEASWPTRFDATRRVVAGAVQRRPRPVEAVLSAGESSTGKRETPTASGVGHHLTGDRYPATRPAPCFAPRGRFGARRREVHGLIPCPAGEVQSGHGRENRGTS